MRCFLAEDGLSGFALKGEDIVSVFSMKRAPMLEAALSLGGTRLDCYDTILPDLCSRSGFRAVDRTRWSDKYGPERWPGNPSALSYHMGRPDIVFMVYDPNRDYRYLTDKARAPGRERLALLHCPSLSLPASSHTATCGIMGDSGSAVHTLEPQSPCP